MLLKVTTGDPVKVNGTAIVAVIWVALELAKLTDTPVGNGPPLNCATI